MKTEKLTAAVMKKKIGTDLYYLDDEDEPTEECVHFYFTASHEGKEVVCDCVLYTLRLHHEAELQEEAENRSSERFDELIKSNPNLTQEQHEEEVGMLMAEIILELEEEEAVKVSEHVEVDPAHPLGLGIDAGLNVPEITASVIEKFIADFRNNSLKLDDTLYSFQTSEDF
ncbi:MAG: hypothetical protein J0L66_02635 [Cytophagales bacterium]|nr:hypothetical protein [Cytophagales bacterium]